MTLTKSFPKILFGMAGISEINEIKGAAFCFCSQIQPGRSFKRKRNKAIVHTHFNNKKLLFKIP